MSYSIQIHNQQKRIPLNRSDIKKIIQNILREQKISRVDLSVVIVTDRKIHEINRKFLKHDFPTDVITFDLSDEEFSHKKSFQIKNIEAEIYVSAVTAACKAHELGLNPEQELLLYIVHGILHLIGYDDHASIDRKRMRKKEKEVLEYIRERRLESLRAGEKA